MSPDLIGDANRPAITTYDPRLVRPLPQLLPADVLAGRDFRAMVYRDNFPIPNDTQREGYLPGNDIAYWLHGLADFLKLANALKSSNLSPKAILDFGSASGRVTRHLCRQLDETTVWACDIDPSHVDWLNHHGPPNVRPFLTSENVGVPIADNQLDLVCAFSVFTHIDETEAAWLAEIRRVLRPGGIAYLTVHNDDTWAALADADSDSHTNRLVNSMLRTGKFQIEDAKQPMPKERIVYQFKGSDLYHCQVFHSNRWIENTWGPFLEVVEIHPCAHLRQSAVVLRKK